LTETQQSKQSLDANASYFLKNLSDYDESVRTVDTYRRIHEYVTAKIAGTKRLLDIGNGGVFAYDTSAVQSITAIDLFLGRIPDELLKTHFPPNAQARDGSALAIPEPNASFDMALMVMLLHHLAGKDWRVSWKNVQTAISEALRVLRPGGKLLVVESCVPRWFFEIERPMFWMLTRMFNSVLSHPITIQFPPQMIEAELNRRSSSVTREQIPKGAAVLQFGFKVPSFLTPVKIFAFEASKASK
jgi:SAM-dependent methyltransferase